MGRLISGGEGKDGVECTEGKEVEEAEERGGEIDLAGPGDDC